MAVEVLFIIQKKTKLPFGHRSSSQRGKDLDGPLERVSFKLKIASIDKKGGVGYWIHLRKY